MRVIIFSKNRAAQAELLLRSIKELVVDWRDWFITVFYHGDNDAFEDSYKILKSIHPEFHYHHEDDEKSLKEQICNLISMEKKTFFSFFVDDLVVIRPFSIHDRQFNLLKENRTGEVLALSLRLNPHISYCQPLNLQTHPCRIKNDGTFEYKKGAFEYYLEQNVCSRLLRKFGLKVFMPIAGDWATQMNLDGNVFRFADFKEYFSTLDEFRSVVQIEPLMLSKPLPGKTIVIYPKSRVINIASNRVRGGDSFPCREENPMTINDKFLNGGRLTYEHLRNIDNHCCHIAATLKFR